MRRLNFGSGPVGAVGWVNADVEAWPQTDIVVVDRSFDPPVLPFRTDEFDYAVAHHVLDMAVDEMDLVGTLRELVRIIRPGGVLRVSSFDLVAAIDAYRHRDETWFGRVVKGELLAEKLGYMLTWYGTRRWLFTADSLTRFMLDAGFRSVRQFNDPTYTGCADRGIIELDSRYDESFFLEAHVARL